MAQYRLPMFTLGNEPAFQKGKILRQKIISKLPDIYSTRPSALGMSDPVVVAWTSCRCPSCPCPPCHMGMSYLISLTPMLLRNIAHDGSFKDFTFVYLCMCVFVIVFVISVRQWIVGVMSFQKIYDLIGLT